MGVHNDMVKRRCSECGKTVWHNPMGTTKKEQTPGYRCTYCATPLGTGPKRDKMAQVSARQIAKAKSNV